MRQQKKECHAVTCKMCVVSPGNVLSSYDYTHILRFYSPVKGVGCCAGGRGGGGDFEWKSNLKIRGKNPRKVGESGGHGNRRHGGFGEER